MKTLDLKDRSVNDAARHIASILGGTKVITTHDRNGVILERISEKRNLFHRIILKKIFNSRPNNFSFSVYIEEGKYNPHKIIKLIQYKELSSITIYFPNVLIGEEKKIKFKTEDLKGTVKEFEVKKGKFTTNIQTSKEIKPQRLLRFTEYQEIFKQGDEGGEMYIVQNGTLGKFLAFSNCPCN